MVDVLKQTNDRGILNSKNIFLNILKHDYCDSKCISLLICTLPTLWCKAQCRYLMFVK